VDDSRAFEQEQEWVEANAWILQGKCRSKPYYRRFFFPTTPNDPLIPTAKRLCSECPVKTECANHAWTYREPFGIWGGIDEWERRRAIAMYGALTTPVVVVATVQEGDFTFDLLRPDSTTQVAASTAEFDNGNEGFVFFLTLG
jgi:WhiB family redox-sensing transcriptional regulator